MASLLRGNDAATCNWAGQVVRSFSTSSIFLTQRLLHRGGIEPGRKFLTDNRQLAPRVDESWRWKNLIVHEQRTLDNWTLKYGKKFGQHENLERCARRPRPEPSLTRTAAGRLIKKYGPGARGDIEKMEQQEVHQVPRRCSTVVSLIPTAPRLIHCNSAICQQLSDLRAAHS